MLQGQGQAALRLGHELVSGNLREERVRAGNLRYTAPGWRAVLFPWWSAIGNCAAWLQHAGVDFPRIKGGYKAMRRWLIDTSDNLISNGHLLLVGGPTGAAKTRLLNEGNAGSDPGSIDLEGLANHRGSAFGRRVTEQPTQIGFELAFGAQLVKHRCTAIEN